MADPCDRRTNQPEKERDTLVVVVKFKAAACQSVSTSVLHSLQIIRRFHNFYGPESINGAIRIPHYTNCTQLLLASGMAPSHFEDCGPCP